MLPTPASPIGVFDSGLGGLTVLKALWEVLPGESTVYLGDVARLPYGNKSPEAVCRYALEAAEFLSGHGIKLLLVACNTVSAVALELLRERLCIPVVGVIEPGAKAALKATQSGRIAVLGTLGTIASKAHQKALLDIQPSLFVMAQACPLFVPLIEEGWLDGEVPTLVARHYLEPVLAANVDTVVLGCTHYPLLASTLSAVLGPDIRQVDSAMATAKHIAQLLGERRATKSEVALHKCFVTDEPERFAQQAKRFLEVPFSEISLCGL